MPPVVTNNNRGLQARNTRSVSVAQNYIQRAAPIFQQQVTNSLSVNGYDSIIYNKLYGGRKCSCSTRVKESPMILDSEGNATQEHINSLLSGTDFGVSSYNDVFSNNPAGSTQDSVNAENPFIEETLTDVGVDYSEEEELLIGEDASNYYLEDNLAATSSGRCGVCYGNSFVGGFNVFNATRIVLDTTVFSSPSQTIIPGSLSPGLFGVVIDTTQSPYRFQLDSLSSYVCFKITIPVGVVSVDSLRVLDNFQYLNTATILIADATRPTFVALSSSNIMSYATGLPCWIQVSAVQQFTHLEIQLNMTDIPTYIEYPRLTKTGDLSVLDTTESVSISISPLVPIIQPWDIIVDNVYGKHWRVTSVQNFVDRNFNIFGWDVQARVVQEYELYYNLCVRYSQYAQTTNFNRGPFY